MDRCRVPSPRVLVAEVSCKWLEAVTPELTRAAIKIRLARSEVQTLDIIRAEHMDLAVIAADVPRLGGLELVRRMHRIDTELPVVLIGGRSDRRWLEEALRLRAQTVLPRPVNGTLVLETILRTLKVRVRVPDWRIANGVN